MRILLPRCLLIACGVAAVAASASAQRTLTTTARVNLRADSRRTSAVKRVLPARAQLQWGEEIAEAHGMLKVVPVGIADTGWVAGEYVIERRPGAGGATVTCGVLRWPVKTLGDADAGAVNRTPRAASIASLRALPAPKVRPQNGRANAVEKAEFGVSGQVIAWGLEADGDFHLVLAVPDSATKTIVLEVPDSLCCAGTAAAARDSIARARRDVVRALGTPPIGVTNLASPAPVTVTGVGFFDFGHSRGHPPNAFELHPVLSIRFGR